MASFPRVRGRSGIFLALAALLPAAFSRQCTNSDIRAGFGTCREGANPEREIYYYLDVAGSQGGSGCVDNGSMVLPPPTRIPCDVSCNPGEFLSMNFTKTPGGFATSPICQQCQAGEYSLGGGYDISGESGGWDIQKWPKGMKTWCIGRRGFHWVLGANDCRTWSPDQNGTVITSGDNRGKSNIMSALTLVVVMKKSGYISFRYQVEAEHDRDGMQFTINSIIKLSLQSNQPTWKKLTYSLEPGSHVLEWYYWKNYGGDYGADRAKLEIVEVSGIDFAELECSKCPKGTESIPGSSACVSCGENEYASDAHYGQCKPCPADTYSFPGAVGHDSCKPRLPCIALDYTKNFTECNLGSRDMFYNWTLPHICNETTGVSLPSPVQGVPCEPCQPGMYKDAMHVCQECGPGNYLASGLTQQSDCETCPLGQESLEEVYYEYWYRWPSGFSTDGGWVLHEDYAYAGGPIDAYANRAPSMQLTLDTTFFQDGAVNFTYEAVNSTDGYDPETDDFGFYVDSKPLGGKLTVSEGMYTVYVEGIQAGAHKLLWNVRGTNIVRLHRVILVGVRGGGATGCVDCKPGFQSSANRESCVPCQPGYISSTGMSCEACPANTYAASTTQCLPCGPGTTSSNGASHCTPFSTVSDEASGHTYNLENILHEFDNPPSKHVNSTYGVEVKIGERTFVFALSRNWPSSSSGGPLLTEKVTLNGEYANTEVRTDSAFGSQNCSIIPEYDYFSAGNELSVYPMPAGTFDHPNPSRGGGLEFHLANGDVCGLGPGSGNGALEGQSLWSSKLQILCDLDEDDIFSSVQAMNSLNLSVADNSSCHPLMFKMASLQACPVCLESDYEKGYSSCTDGKRKVTYYRKIPCIGEPSQTTEECHMKFSATVIGAMAAGIIVAVLIAAAFAYYLFRLRRRYLEVHSKYVLLRDGYDKNSFSLAPSGASETKDQFEIGGEPSNDVEEKIGDIEEPAPEPEI